MLIRNLKIIYFKEMTFVFRFSSELDNAGDWRDLLICRPFKCPWTLKLIGPATAKFLKPF